MTPRPTQPIAASPLWPPAPAGAADVLDRLRWYPAVARWAPSKHNTQPWRFVVRGASLELWTDPRRALPDTDPKMRELVISCGAALHHVEIAGRALGRHLAVELLPDGGLSLLARVFEVGDAPVTAHDEALLSAIARRHTDRGPLDASPLGPSLPFQLQSTAAETGASLRLVSTAGDRATLASLVERADRILVRDGRVDRELGRWLRGAADTRRDGVPDDHTRGPAASYRAEFVQRDFSGGRGTAAHDRPGRDHPLIGVLCTAGDRVGDWLSAGRALSAVLLEPPLGTAARRHRLRRPDRDAGVRRQQRHRHRRRTRLLRPVGQARPPRRHQHRVRPHQPRDYQRRPGRPGRPAHRLQRKRWPQHRTAPALRDPHRRPFRRPSRVLRRTRSGTAVTRVRSAAAVVAIAAPRCGQEPGKNGQDAGAQVPDGPAARRAVGQDSGQESARTLLVVSSIKTPDAGSDGAAARPQSPKQPLPGVGALSAGPPDLCYGRSAGTGSPRRTSTGCCGICTAGSPASPAAAPNWSRLVRAKSRRARPSSTASSTTTGRRHRPLPRLIPDPPVGKAGLGRLSVS